MTRFGHPIRGADLLATPEMALRHAAENEDSGHSSSYDEGAGCGFDNMSPDAYAERWVEIDARPKAVFRWYEEQLVALGWQVADRRRDGPSFVRDVDERIGVTGFGQLIRVSFAVDGVFPDGRTGIRVG